MKLRSDKGHSKVIHHVKGHLKNQIKSKGFYQLCKSKGFFATHLYSVLAVYYYLLRTPKKNSPVPIQFIFNHLIWEFERSELTSTRKNFLLIIQEKPNQTTAIMYNPHKGKPKKADWKADRATMLMMHPAASSWLLLIKIFKALRNISRVQIFRQRYFRIKYRKRL